MANQKKDVDPIPDENVTKNKTDKNTKIQNPAKKYKRRKNKTTNKLTKNYYNVNDKKDSISPEEYKERLRIYRDKKSKGGTIDKNSFSGYIKGQLINETKSNYGKFRQYLKEILK